MLRAERKHDGVVSRGALQFEIEGAAKAFAQSQEAGAIQARAEWRMDDELHAAGFVEETLHDECVLRGQGAEGFVGGGEIIGELARTGIGDVVFVFKPVGQIFSSAKLSGNLIPQ